MGNRDDFSPDIKRALAERAGHRCSFPGCPSVTIGPSNEGEASVSRTGMACHIAAAAGGTGARRYVATMTNEQRTSIENGVWMCYTHGKLVDTDENRFSIPMLQKWRELAEFRAQWAVDHGIEKPLPQYVMQGRVGFADEEIKFTELSKENELIGLAFNDCCVETMWPASISRTVRDVIIELVRNSLTHGLANQCIVRMTKDAIYVSDDGIDFSCLDLRSHPKARGGASTIQHLIDEYGSEVILGSKRENGLNQTMFAPAGGYKGIGLARPCAVSLDRHDWEVIKGGSLPAWFLDGSLNPCRIVYVMLPHFISPSDAYKLRERVSIDALKEKQIVFVAGGASELVRKQLQELFPGCRVLVPN
jgi:hypothetical protein